MSFRKALPRALTLFTLIEHSFGTTDIFGLRKNIYVPRCAHACRAAIQLSPLECTSSAELSISAQCYASNDPFLQTLAYCISSQCGNISSSDLEQYWDGYVVGWDLITPSPKYNYQTALNLAGQPNITLRYSEPLVKVSLIAENDYIIAYTSLADWDESEVYHTRFALALFILGFAIPIFLSLLRLIPTPSTISSRYRALFIYPTVWSKRWKISMRDASDINPTRGQAIFILYMLTVNVALASTGHFTLYHYFWSFDGRHGQFITCLANRFGALSLANIPLLFLYSGRNNVMLKLTNWSHPTFLVLHRWLAYITVSEAILHSVLYLRVAVSEGKHSGWVKMSPWYFGSIGTVAISLIVPFSIVAIRRRIYEFFLVSHVAFSIVVIIGIYYHVSELFNTRWSGYVLYLWISVLFWAFDRTARLIRLGLNGVSKATVTVIDNDYIRVDIPNAKGSGHAYLYFPTLTWRVWENHPFSIATSPRLEFIQTLDRSPRLPPFEVRFALSLGAFSSQSHSDKSSPSLEMKSVKSFDTTYDGGSPTSLFAPITPMTPTSPFSLFSPTSDKSLLSPTSTTNLVLFPEDKPLPAKPKGLTFFMRTHSGTTGLLRKRTSLPVLVEASYGIPRNFNKYQLLICVAGGVGITAILPYLHVRKKGSAKLYWGCRSGALVSSLRQEVRGYEGEILVGRRLFIKLALQREFTQAGDRLDVAVVVSGPKGMADDARELCCEMAKRRSGDVMFVDENFGW